MISTRKTKPAGGGRSCVLRVRLEAEERDIWRLLRVPGEANLGWLHAVLQIAMGWTNSHLHAFRFGDQVISDPACELDEFAGDSPAADEKKVRIDQLLTRKGSLLYYEYDFGDSWNHVIQLEDYSASAGLEPGKAVCLDGAGACPPEDCGGLSGYEEMLLALKDRKHPEHHETKEWLGKSFNPDHFSVKDANRWLKKLRWPRVTEEALGDILMARDGD